MSRVLNKEMVRPRRGSMPYHSTSTQLSLAITMAQQIITHGQLSKPYLQPCLN